jgi:hypothetical protein
MPNKNIINEILRAVLEISEISLLDTFSSVWRFLIKKHRQASMKKAMFNYQLQMAGTTYQPKIYLHKYSTGNIKSLKINFIRLNYRDFYQTPIN